MKFKLSTTGFFYSLPDAEKLGKLGMAFENLGFQNKPYHRTGAGEIEMQSLEDLMAFSKKWGDLIIISRDNPPEIEIYDDYRE